MMLIECLIGYQVGVIIESLLGITKYSVLTKSPAEKKKFANQLPEHSPDSTCNRIDKNGRDCPHSPEEPISVCLYVAVLVASCLQLEKKGLAENIVRNLVGYIN